MLSRMLTRRSAPASHSVRPGVATCRPGQAAGLPRRGALSVSLSLCLLVGCGSSDAGELLAGSGASGRGGDSGAAGMGGTSAGGGGQAGADAGDIGGSAGNYTAGAGGAAGSAGAVACDLNGRWASYLEIDVAWAGTTVLQPGADMIRVWLVGDRTGQADQAQESVSTCGITLPDFQSNLLGGNEKFGVRFPGEVFDLGGIPQFNISFGGNVVVGGELQSEPVALLIGHTMANPLTDPWPAISAIKATDPDADTKPGLTGVAVKGNGFGHPPTDALRLERAKALWIVSRTAVEIAASLTTCDQLNGSLSVLQVASQPGLQSHIVGCIKDNGEPCTSTETGFLDTNRPDFQPATSSRFVSKRVDAAVSCAQVRGMFQ